MVSMSSPRTWLEVLRYATNLLRDKSLTLCPSKFARTQKLAPMSEECNSSAIDCDSKHLEHLPSGIVLKATV